MSKARDIADFKFENIVDTGTEGLTLPKGTTAQRGTTVGQIRYNTTTNLAEYYDGTNYKSLDAPPSITNIDYAGTTLAANPAGGETIVISGGNISTTGTVSVTVGGVTASSVTVSSSTSLSFVSPANTAGDYTLEITNPSGLSAQATFSYSINPLWNTAVDTVILSDVQGATVNITSLAAAEGSDTITYAEPAGTLAGLGLALNTSTCAITGTLPTVTADTTYSFTLVATDEENQTSSRQFKITVTANYFGSGDDGSLNT